MKCPFCKQEFNFSAGDVWINEQGYKVRILDWGTVDVWLFYEENENRVSWKIVDFLKEYKNIKN